MQQSRTSQNMKTQRGVVLFVGLIMTLLTTIIGITAVQTTTLQEKMAHNQQERHKSLQAAEAAARYAWSTLDSSAFSEQNFTSNSANPGLYDLRSTNVNTATDNKLRADWNALASSTLNWPWTGTTERAAMPNKITYSDPMKLAVTPQYIIGMQAPILRKGTENRKCIPFTIIGAGQGSTTSSQSYIKLQVIPKGGCFLDIVR